MDAPLNALLSGVRETKCNSTAQKLKYGFTYVRPRSHPHFCEIRVSQQSAESASLSLEAQDQETASFCFPGKKKLRTIILPDTRSES